MKIFNGSLRIAMFTLAVLLIIAVSNSVGLIIGFDVFHDADNDPLSAFPKFAGAFTSQGHTIFEINQEISSAVLDSLDVLITPDPEIKFSVAEILALQEFFTVQGKDLIFIGETALAFAKDSANDIISPYGISFTGNENVGNLTFFALDPLTTGVSDFFFGGGGALDVSGQATVLGKTSAGGLNGIAQAGRHLFVINDSDAFKNSFLFNGSGNMVFLQNLVAELGTHRPPFILNNNPIPEPDSVLLLLAGILTLAMLVLYRRLRKCRKKQ